MKFSRKSGDAKAWSERSQHSYLEQRRLEGELSNTEILIRQCEMRIGKIKELVARATSDTANGRNPGLDLSRELAEKENEKRKLGAYKEHIADLRAKIKALAHPTAEQKADRTKQQNLLAKLARERLDTVRSIDSALEKLRRLLRLYLELSDQMETAADSIDLDRFSRSDPGEIRKLEGKLESFPDRFSPEAERWVDWFFGEEKQGTKTYLVRRKTLELRETLASHHVHFCGDEVDLTEAEASKLLSQSREYDPPIVSVEAVYGAKAKAQRNKPTMTIEILSEIQHGGVGGQVTVYKPGVHTLPRELALKFLLDRVPVDPSKAYYEPPLARLCKETSLAGGSRPSAAR